MLTLITDKGPRAVEAMLFDMDGTMVDSNPLHVDAWVELTDRLKPGLDVRAEIPKYFGLSNRQIIPEIVGREMTREEIDAFSAEKEAVYRELAHGRIQPVGGLLELVDKAETAGIGLAVASSAIEANIRFILEEFGLTGRFKSVVHTGRVAKGKPDPETFLLAGRELGADPARCVVFEDALHGLEGARRAGMISVRVATHAVAGHEDYTDLTVRDFHEAMERLTP